MIKISKTVGIENAVAKQLDSYCKQTGKQKQHVVTQAVQALLRDKTGGEK